MKHKHNVSGQPRQIRRRDALILLGGTAAAWPLGVAAQPVGMPTVGFLTTQSRDTAMPYVAAFKTGLEQSGFVEGRDVKIEYRWADGQIGRLGDLAAEIARLGAAVIFAGGGPTTAKAAAAAAPSTPIVFSTGGDPVRDGLVASLNRPGGHLTGVSLLVSELNAKRLEFLHELVSGATTVGVLVDPDVVSTGELQGLDLAAAALGVTIHIARARNQAEIDPAIASLVEQRIGALLVASSALFTDARFRLVELAARHGLPAIYHARGIAIAGGLASYGPSFADGYRQGGVYVGRILKGEKAGDLPVQQPTKFEFVINLRTAKTLGLTIPPTLLARADEVIE